MAEHVERVAWLVTDYERLLSGLERETVTVDKLRDLSIVPLIGGISLVIACDSNAGNGEKELDMHPNPAHEVAVSALKVPLMEVLSSGAVPLIVVNNLCVEMDPYGRRLIGEMRAALERCGLGNVQLTGSTEDNMKTMQTGIGVTVIGMAREEGLLVGKAQEGDIIVCVGIPQSGIRTPYSEFAPDVAKIETVAALVKQPYIHELLPVGSKGARYEAHELARVAGLTFVEANPDAIDLATSAGASTAVLAAILPEDLDRLKRDAMVVCHPIGTMIKGNKE